MSIRISARLTPVGIAFAMGLLNVGRIETGVLRKRIRSRGVQTRREFRRHRSKASLEVCHTSRTIHLKGHSDVPRPYILSATQTLQHLAYRAPGN